MDDRRLALLRRDLQDQWEITGVRPALFTEGLAGRLNELRGFRHFFRHAYDSELHSERVTALALRPELRDSLDRFIARLQAG